MKGRNTRVLHVRIPDELYPLIMKRAGRKDWSVNQWLLWAVKEGLRDHHSLRRG